MLNNNLNFNESMKLGTVKCLFAGGCPNLTGYKKPEECNIRPHKWLQRAIWCNTIGRNKLLNINLYYGTGQKRKD